MFTKNHINMKGITILFAIAALAFLGLKAVELQTREEVTVRVNRLERVTTGSGNDVTSKYMVYATVLDSETLEPVEKEVFENTDMVLPWKQNSSDVYNELEEGGVYRVEVIGWRVRVLSMYRNVLKITKKVASP